MFSIKRFLLLVLLSSSLLLIGSVRSEIVDETPDYEDYQLDALFSSNRYTQPETDAVVSNNPLVKLDGYSVVAENEKLRLYVKLDDLSIRVEDIRSGYVWGSSFDTTDQRLNKTWRARVNSAVWITYYRKTAVREEVIEESITTSGLSTLDTTLTQNGFTSDIVFGESNIRLTLSVELTADGLKVDIPFASITETETNRLGTVRVFPFLGAVLAKENVDVPGYTLLPDGVGALMRFQPQGVYQHLIYSKPIYNRDYGLYNYELSENLIEEPGISVPLYGIVHGSSQHAFYAWMTEGDTSARIISYPAGRTTDFYWTFFETVYRIQYEQPTSRNMGSVVTTQAEMNGVDTRIIYTFLDGNEANYVGMANDYHDKLIEKHNLASNSNTGDIPVRLEFLMRERKPGLLFDSYVNVTKTEDVISIVDSLKTLGVEEQTIVLRGWSNRGYTGSSPDYQPFESSSGKSGYAELFEHLNQLEYEYYLNADYTKGYFGAGGYNVMTDLARKITGSAYTGAKMDYSYYWLHPQATANIFEKDLSFYKDNDVNGLALESIGKDLFSSHGRETFQRNQSVDKYLETLNAFSGSIALYQPNEYAVVASDLYFDVPFYSSLQAKFTDTVPFIPLAFRGLVEMYSTPVNFFNSMPTDILRMIDFGIYPSYILTQSSSSLLMDTPSEYISSSQYDVWEEIIIAQYTYINEILKTSAGSMLESREVCMPGVIKNTYANDVIHYINYTADPVRIGSLTIAALDIEVIQP
ncbi:MAG: hypothetical protein JXB20_06845 [Bacilli bacterium]|nr:hypothetical protein [Bacilli bacterium]